ncbi:MAG: outer membrane protein assembly factor BamD [Betaproteobacteria bacterium]|nr:outer membrane protein assembly factor BamD [Betaproteobacteria bacterium]
MQRNKMKPLWFALLTLGLAAPVLSLQVSCEIKPISELSPEDGIVRLRGLHKDESWERLIQEVNEYRSRFPYSQYASEAELLQGDAFFRTKRFPEAISNYEDFVRRNPSHPQADFALFRVAKSFDLQCPEDEQREQATTQRALDKYAELKRRFPRSQHIAESNDRSAVLRKRLADHHIFVANFYWKKSLFHAALNRYLYVVDTFDEQKDLQVLALQRASESYLWLAKELERNPKSDAVSFYTSQTPDQLKQKSAELIAKRKSLLGSQPTKTSEKEG